VSARPQTRREQSEWIAILASTAVALWLCWSMLRPFVQVIAWAAILAILFFPAHRWIQRRVRRPALAAGLSLLLVLITVIAPLLFVTTTLVRELADAVGALQAAGQRMRTDPDAARTFETLRRTVQQYVDVDALLQSDKLRDTAAVLGQALLQRSAMVIGGLLGFIVSALLTVFTLYYLFRDGENIARRLPDLLPLPRPDAERIIARVLEMITASVYGVVVIAIVQGTLGGLLFAILGLPSPIVWGVVMTVMSTVPMAGSALIWAPAAAFLFLTGQYGRGAVLVFCGVFVIGMADNLLRPRLVSRRTQMHELLVFFSVVGGLAAFGVLGLLLGPVVLAIALALLEMLFVRREPDAAAPAGA
jgi:predicted PurR-regulated permease PerM